MKRIHKFDRLSKPEIFMILTGHRSCRCHNCFPMHSCLKELIILIMLMVPLVLFNNFKQK